MKVYQYSKCSSCRNALRFLRENDIKFKSIDIVETPPTKAEIKKMLKALGLKRLINTSGQVYRQMGLSKKELSESEWVSLLADNGKLIKRPFIIDSKVHLTGFKVSEWEEVLL